MVRETPLHLGHLRSMVALTEAGAIVYPLVPAFYAKPGTIGEVVEHKVGRVLDLFDLDTAHRMAWSRLRLACERAGLIAHLEDVVPGGRSTSAHLAVSPASRARTSWGMHLTVRGRR